MRKEISKKDIPDLILDLCRGFTVYAPHKKGKEFIFDKVEDPKKVTLTYPTTTLPPTKYFLPPRECLFEYSNGNLKRPNLRERTLLFGVHLVDIHAIIQLDEIMSTPKEDFYYQKRRDNTTIIGITGNDKFDDFHLALGVDVHKGYDVFLEDAGDRFLSISISKKGDHLLGKKWFKKTKICEQKIHLGPTKSFKNHLYELKSAVERTKNSKVWKKYADQCFGCGNCSFVCPLCFCFDVEDKPSLESRSRGHRERHFDACFFKSFTTVSARGEEGFTFENEHKDRFYRWYHHKFVQMIEEFGQPGCVNCGRCVKYCPAGINFKEVLEEAKEEMIKKLKSKK